MRDMIRKSRVLPFGAVIAVAIASVAGANVLANSEGTPSSAEVQDFAADAQISESEAKARLRDQTKLSRLALLARQALRRGFGGVWVDAKSNDRIKLGVRTPDRERRRSAHRAITQAGLRGRVDVVAVPRGEAELRTLQGQLDRTLRDVNRGAVDHIDAVPISAMGVVELLIPRRSDVTPAQRRFIASARWRFGHRVRVRRGPGRLVLESVGVRDAP